MGRKYWKEKLFKFLNRHVMTALAYNLFKYQIATLLKHMSTLKYYVFIAANSTFILLSDEQLNLILNTVGIRNPDWFVNGLDFE